MSLADECGTDVEIYRRFGSPVIYADSRTGAPEELLQLLDTLGLDRHTLPPFYIWHQVPDDLPEDAQHQVASRAFAAVHLAGYRVNIDPDVVDEPALVAAFARPAGGAAARGSGAGAGCWTAAQPLSPNLPDLRFHERSASAVRHLHR